MKKLLTLSCIALVFATGCSDNSTTETTTTNQNTETKKPDSWEQQIKDSTRMLDKKLADPNSNYSPDSLK